MPKISYLPPPDIFKDLIKRYQKAQKLTASDIGKRMSKSADAVRCKLHRGTDKWTVADVRAWCKALNITSAEEVGNAILGHWRKGTVESVKACGIQRDGCGYTVWYDGRVVAEGLSLEKAGRLLDGLCYDKEEENEHK